jgi:hypothetical protein
MSVMMLTALGVTIYSSTFYNILRHLVLNSLSINEDWERVLQ